MTFFILYMFNDTFKHIQTRCCINFSIPILILKYLKIIREFFTKISLKISYKKKYIRHKLLSFTISYKSIHKNNLNKCIFKRHCRAIAKDFEKYSLDFLIPNDAQNLSQSLTTTSRINYLKEFLELEFSKLISRRDVSANN